MWDEDMPSDEDEQRFFTALGRAITAWADLEEVLFAMTHDILSCSKERAAIVFYRIPTIDSRISLVDDLIDSFFPKHEAGEHPDRRIERWLEIQKEIRKHLSFRNRLAHQPVGPVVELRETEGGNTETQIIQASYISHPESLRKRSHPEPAGLNEIREYRLIVSRMVNSLRNFHRLEFRKRLRELREQETATIPRSNPPDDTAEPQPQLPPSPP